MTSPESLKRPRRTTPEDVFKRLEFGETRYNGVRCLLYTRKLSQGGYARMSIAGELWPLHRWMYERWISPIGEGLHLDHLCRVRHCVNPLHLEPVTNAENIRRGETGRNYRDRTHCKHGHEYTPENTRMDGNRRRCRKCAVMRKAKARRKKRGLA